MERRSSSDRGKDTGFAERARRIELAKSYPFPRPPYSYVLAGGETLELVHLAGDRLEDAGVRAGGLVLPLGDYLKRRGLEPPRPMSERVAVLAHGSNASPEHLKRKFEAGAGEATIPVIRAWLEGFDVVFAPHFTRYGAIPSTLEVSAGSSVSIAVTFLDRAELQLMHASELAGVRYLYGRLARVRCVLEALPPLDQAFVYIARRGSLRFEGHPFALAALACERRRFEAKDSAQALGLARDLIAPGRALDDFILETIEDAAIREARSEVLAGRANGIATPHFEVLEG